MLRPYGVLEPLPVFECSYHRRVTHGRSFDETFGPRRAIAFPTRFYRLGTDFIVEWHQPGSTVREFRSGADLARSLRAARALPPSVFIFHAGRCGSTLLARLLDTDTANRVFIEPGALLSALETIHPAHPPALLDVLVRSYGLDPVDGERRLVIKLNSLAVWQLPLFRAAFPDAHFVYLFRDPAAVVASFVRSTPAFLEPPSRDRLAERLWPGWHGDAIRRLTLEEWCATYVNANLRTAWRFAGEFSEVSDYAECPDGYLRIVNRWQAPPVSSSDAGVARVLAMDAKRPGLPFARGRSRSGEPERHAACPALASADEAVALWRR